MSLRIALFYHSLVSDWNHGNAHFLRGIAADLLARGHTLRIYEPQDNWSLAHLLAEHGAAARDHFEAAFPQLRSTPYQLDSLDLERELESVDLALVHEWNDPELLRRIGRYRRTHLSFRVLFHDTHHRALTAPHEIARFPLGDFDGVLAYGASLQEAYRRLGWGKQVHIWHEAADTRVFYPRPAPTEQSDLVWIGNWGDEERTAELNEFLIEPVHQLGLRADVFGVRYPEPALARLAAANISYRGWIPNFLVPETFAQFRITVHVPRRPYTQQLRGIPTIRPFEALACGIPLVSAPWEDSEHLFRAGRDFLMVPDGPTMQARLRDVLSDHSLARSLAASGLDTIRARHTCTHRVDELLSIYRTLQPAPASPYLPSEVTA